MSEHGTLFDTYVATLQHDFMDLPDGVVTVGVVRRPTRWLHPYVDENLAAFGPPEDLLDTFQNRHTALTEQGIGDPDAHRALDCGLVSCRRRIGHIDSGGGGVATLQLFKWILDYHPYETIPWPKSSQNRAELDWFMDWPATTSSTT